MRKLLVQGTRMFHLINIDYDVKSRVCLRRIRTWRLEMPEMPALFNLLGKASTECKETIHTFDNIRVGHVWEIVFLQA